MSKASNARRRQIMQMTVPELLTAYKARSDVHNVCFNKLTIVFSDGNHIHLEDQFYNHPELTNTDMYKMYLCELEK